jgi:radical SAM protein with 4Fe4S-binding SPASM domain
MNLTLLSHFIKVFKKSKALPSYFIFYPTNRCNLKCSHCFYHDSLNKKHNELNISEINTFTKTMDSILHLILTGGEPYLRDDLDKIIEIFYKNTNAKLITIPSNGWYFNKIFNVINKVLVSCPNLILNQQISLDGIGIEHDKIRMDKFSDNKKNSFERAAETIVMLKELKKKYDNRINIGIITTFTNQNQYEFKKIVEYFFNHFQPDNISINLVRGNPKEKVNLNLDINLYDEAVKFRDELYYQKKMSGQKNFTGNKIATASRILLNEYVLKTQKEGKYSLPCFAGNISGVMYSEGDVYPCELLDEKHKIGNIREYRLNFKDLWLSIKADKEKKFIKETKCFCTHECFNHANIVFNPKLFPKIISKSLKL